MTNPNLAIQKTFVAALFAGDQAKMKALLSPDYELVQPAGLAYAGTYRGFDGFMAFLEKYGAAYDLELLEDTDAFYSETNPDIIVFQFHSKGTVKSSGQPFDSTILEPWTFRDGKITGVRPHWFELPKL